ncbi:MAG TPA: glycosyltransferase [Solirubrobacterales bacterium]|nr:glycosyltransferase [Solirubrobacterales bacterium]
MRLLYVCLDRGIPLGAPKGAAVHIEETLRAVAAEGHATAVLAHSTAEGHAPPCPAYLAPAPPEAASAPGSRRLRLALRRVIERFRPDLVYERYALFRTEARGETWAADIPLVLEVNAPLVEETERFRRLRLGSAAVEAERYAWTRADLVVTPSERLADLIRSAGQERVLVIPNAVDPDRFDPSDDGGKVRHRLGLDDRFVVAWAGRLKGWHDPDTLVDAVAKLPKRLRPALLLIGDGPDRTGVERRATECNVTSVTTGAVSPRRVPELLAAADACVATLPADPSLHYFSPLKALEYLAAGRATVVARAGALTALAEAGAALAYRPGDPADLAARLEAVARDAGLRRGLARRGRSYAEGRTWRDAARATVDAAEALRPSERALGALVGAAPTSDHDVS